MEPGKIRSRNAMKVLSSTGSAGMDRDKSGSLENFKTN